MKYKHIKEFTQRCEEHSDHQSGMISYGMIQQRLQEEIDELREYIEQRQWVGLTDEEEIQLAQDSMGKSRHWLVSQVEGKLKEKNT